MANKKITDLVEITSAADVDVLAIVDVSADTTNKIKVDNLPVSAPVQTALDTKQETLVSGTNIKTINSTSLLGSGDISLTTSAAGTSGQIQFNDSSAFGADSNLYWANTNKRLGVGETTPTARVHIKGSGSTSATNSLLVQNSSGTAALTVQDDSVIRFYGSKSLFGTATGSVFQIQDNGAKHTIHANGLSSPRVMLRSGGNNTSLCQYVNNTINGTYIGRDEITPNASAVLDVGSTTQGFLPPRMTTTQKNAISSPAAGLQVYDSTTNRAAVYTSAWENVITETNGSPNSVYKLWSGSAAQYAALTPDSSTLYFVI